MEIGNILNKIITAGLYLNIKNLFIFAFYSADNDGSCSTT